MRRPRFDGSFSLPLRRCSWPGCLAQGQTRLRQLDCCVRSVTVRTLAGTEIVVERDEDTATVGDLKRRIAKVSNIPPTLQTLILGEHILSDDELVGVIGDGKELTLLSYGNIFHEEPHMRVAAIRDLVEASGDVKCLAVLAGDDITEVRRVALEALARLSEPGDVAVIDLIFSCMHDPSEEVRSAAIRAAAEVAFQGDDRTVVRICACLGDADKEALTRLAVRGTDYVISQLHHCLGDLNRHVRRAAVESIAALASPGDARSIERLCMLLDDWDRDVRKAATEALPELVERASGRILEALLPRLADQDAGIRRAAVPALRRLARRGDARVAAFLRQRLECLPSGRCTERDDVEHAWAQLCLEPA